MSTFEEAGMQAGEESTGGDHPQNSMGQIGEVTGKAEELLRT